MIIKEKLFFTEATREAQRVKDRLVILSEELELAKMWNRPSLLIATYRSEYVKEYAASFLEELILEKDEKVSRFRVNKIQFDIPAEIRNLSSRQDEIFFISGLRSGGGKSGRNAYRALNIRREILVDEKIRAVFWLTESEAHGLPRFAPDFWAFRHRVIELDDFYFQSFRRFSKLEGNMIWHEKTAQRARDKGVELIMKDATLLAENANDIPIKPGTLKDLYLYAYVLWKKGSSQKALSLLNHGDSIAAQIKNPQLRAKLLSGVGIVHFHLKNFSESIEAFLKANSLSTDDDIIWNNLSLPLYFVGQVEDALSSVKKAITKKNKNPRSWRTLGSYYLDLGHLDDARLAYQRSVKHNPQDPLAWYSLGIVFKELENSKKALHAFRKANKIDSSFAIPDK